MNATKTSFQNVNNVLVEWVSFGSLPALKWTDGFGNNWRAIGSYQFDSTNEVYTIVVDKYIQPVGVTEWTLFTQYNLTASCSTIRVLSTGVLVKGIAMGEYDPNAGYPTVGSGTGGAVIQGDNWLSSVDGSYLVALVDAPGQDPTKWGNANPQALNSVGQIIDPNGWLCSAKYFTIGIGYNPSGAPVSINYWVYLEIADHEGLTIV